MDSECGGGGGGGGVRSHGRGAQDLHEVLHSYIGKNSTPLIRPNDLHASTDTLSISVTLEHCHTIFVAKGLATITCT